MMAWHSAPSSSGAAGAGLEGPGRDDGRMAYPLSSGLSWCILASPGRWQQLEQVGPEGCPQLQGNEFATVGESSGCACIRAGPVVGL